MMTSSNGNMFRVTGSLCAGNSPVTGKFPPQRPVTRSFDIFFDLRLNKWSNKQSWRQWFEMPSSSLWCHCNEMWWVVLNWCIDHVVFRVNAVISSLQSATGYTRNVDEKDQITLFWIACIRISPTICVAKSKSAGQTQWYLNKTYLISNEIIDV